MLVLRSVFLFFSLLVAVTSARKKDSPPVAVEKNTTSWTSWYDYLQPPSMEELQQRVEKARKNVEKDMLRSKEDFELSAKEFRYNVTRGIGQQKRLFKRAVQKRVLKQRFGWERARHSVRDYLGLAIGTTMVFTGYSNPFFKDGGSLALQAAQIGWELSPIGTLPHEPWVRDTAAGAFGIVTAKVLPATVSTAISPVYLSLALFRTMNNVMEDVFCRQDVTVVASLSVLASLVVVAIATHQGIPLALAAASISGARLVFDSIVAEIAGNWCIMLEYIMPVVRVAMWLFICVLRILWTPFKLLVKLVRFVWRTLASVTPEPLKKLYRRIAWRLILSYRMFRSFQARVKNYPPIQSFRHFLSRLKYAIKHNRPVIFPWAVAACGVARQMGYATSFQQMVSIVKTILDPIRAFGKIPKKEIQRELQAKHGQIWAAIVGFFKSRGVEKEA